MFRARAFVPGCLIAAVLSVCVEQTPESTAHPISLPESEVKKQLSIKCGWSDGTRRRARIRRFIDVGRLTTGGVDVAAPFRTEQYDFVAEDGFLAAARDPLSTFSIDVDTASYSNVRRILRQGELPPAGATRIEELVNYFTFDEAPRTAEHPFAVGIEWTRAPWAPDHSLVRVGLRGMEIEEADVPPRNLVFLVDVSGSMACTEKLSLVKRAMGGLVERLRPEDHVAIVVYAGASGLVLPPTPGARRGDILVSLKRLEAGGSTNGGSGIRLAYQLAREHFDPDGINRVILATDGDFNVGITSRSELVEIIEEERESGVFLTVLGVGSGNLKDATMEQLADHGNGNYAYLDGFAEARKVLVREAGGTLVTVAKDVKLQVEFNPQRVAAYRLIGYENRRLANEDFNDDRKDAGEIGAGHSVTAFYEVVPAGTEVDTGAVDPLRYQDDAPAARPDRADEVLTVKVRYKAPEGGQSQLLVRTLAGELEDGEASQDLRFGAAVALFGMLLRDSAYRGEGDFDLVLELARGALGPDPYGDRGEFLGLAVLARDLKEDR